MMELSLKKSSYPEIIHQESDGWYFWHETWAHRSGPFPTRELCSNALDNYLVTELGYPPEELGDH